MTRIFIENYEVDVDKELSNQITYAVSDLKFIDSKSSAFTKTIVLPGTSTNNNILGNIFEFNNSNFTNDNLPNVKYNFNAAKSSKCRIDVDGMTVIKGVFRILEIIWDGNNVEYECSVTGELGGFAMKMAAKKIEELDFSAYDHDLTIANIKDSWNNDNGGSGIYYPLIDVGNVSTGPPYGTYKKDYQYQAFRPALFAKEYIDKIFEVNGYTYDCDLFNTDRFKRLIIPHNQKQLFKNVSRLAEGNIVTPQLTMFDPSIYESISFDNQVLSNFTRIGNTYKYTGSTTVQMTVDITINGRYESDLQDLFFSFYLNSTRTNMANLPNLGGPGSTTYSFNFVFDFVISTNDVIQFAVESPSSIGDYAVYIDDASFTVDAIVPQLAEATIGDHIEMRFSIPKNILQKDFFTSILKLFNLYVDEDRYNEKHLIIKPYPDFYSGVEDWSDKVDRGKPIRFKPMSELNSRYYQFKYKSDNDYYNDLYRKRYNEGYGDRTFDSVFEFTNETQSVELIFAATPMVGYSGVDKVVSTVFKQNNGVEEKIDHVIRILQARKISGVSSWSIMDTTTILDTVTDFPYAGHLDDPDAPVNDLNFGVPKELFFILAAGGLNINQFNVYYYPYMAEITDKDSRLMICDLKLTNVDVFNLDFSKYKYIDGGLYRLQKLIDYTPETNDTTRAELLKVIYTTY